MQRRTLLTTAMATAVAGLSTLPVFAQGNWPTGKPITYMTPAQQDSFFNQERSRWAKVVSDANIKLD